MNIKSVFVLTLSSLFIVNAFADEGDSSDLSLEDLLNTGFKASLIKAIEAKRNATGSQDTIVSEDIADFPDLNLAESIQRMPGVAITREGGEGRQISLRGIGPDYTRVQINGMETIAKTNSPMDSRGANSRDRAFDFNIFASEMFGQIDILKSYSADVDEGGIGGTVQLWTPKPFEVGEQQLVFSGSGGTNPNVEGISPRLNAFYSDTWGEHGLLATGFYSNRAIEEEGVNTYRWRQRSTTNYNPSISVEAAQLLEDGDIWFPRGNRYSVWENDQERIGLNITYQFKPSDEFELGVSYIHAQLNNERHEYHLATAGSSSTALGTVEEIEYELNGDHYEFVSGTFSDLTLRTEHRYDIAETTYDQMVFDIDWQATEKLNVKWLVGASKSFFDLPVSDKAYLETIDGEEFSADYSGDEYNPDQSYGFDTTAESEWRVRELDFREDFYEDTYRNAKWDLEYDLDAYSSVSFGIGSKVFKNTGATTRDDNYVRSQSTPENDGVTDLDPSYLEVYDGHEEQNWLTVDVEDIQDYYGLDGDVDANPSDYIEESTFSGYVQYNHDTYLVDYPVRYDVGLRFYHTEIEYGFSYNDRRYKPTGNYNGFLPAANVAVDVTDDLVIRMSGSQNINRPQIDDARLGVSLDTGNRTVNANGNVDMEPLKSNNYEMSIEWYFSDSAYFAFGYFTKNITGFLEEKTSTVAYSETGLPTSLLPDGQSGSTEYDYTRLENKGDATINGVEVSFQTDFFFLPQPFNNMGLVSNFTVIEGNADYRNVQGTGETESKRFPGLSELAGNLTLYYETSRWGARVSAAYRDEYIQFVEAGLGDEDERGVLEQMYVDFSAGYQVNNQLKVSFEALNLTDQQETQYSDSNKRLYNNVSSGPSYNLGLNYHF